MVPPPFSWPIPSTDAKSLWNFIIINKAFDNPYSDPIGRGRTGFTIAKVVKVILYYPYLATFLLVF